MQSINVILLFTMFVALPYEQDTFYSNAFGDPDNPAIIFLHDGPGYNSYSFEYSTAQKLSEKGFYVIVYDQRGCGRTLPDTNSLFTFNEAFADLNAIYTKYNLQSATLICHGFGGTIGILFSDSQPERVDNLILVGVPISYQMTFKHIISECKLIYSRDSSSQLQPIEMLERMDTASLAYSSYCLMHAMSNRFDQPQNPSEASNAIMDSLLSNPMASYLSNTTNGPVSGFFEQEHYTTLDLTSSLTQLQGKINVVGIYGREDVLFGPEQLRLLQATIGSNKIKFVDSASHAVFIDQQEIFIHELVEVIDGNLQPDNILPSPQGGDRD